MSEFGRRFDPAELDDDGRRPSDAEAAGLLATARDLEAFARSEELVPGMDFEDRVMAAIAAEPPPRPIAAGGGVAGLLLAVRDAWRITWSGGRPLAVRAQAFALVLVATVAVGSVGSLATVGVARLLVQEVPPAPTIPPGPSPSPSDSPSPSPTATETNESGGAGATDTPTDETQEPDETPESTGDSSGSGSGDDSGSGSGSDSGSGSGSGDDSGSGSGGDSASGSGDGPAKED